MSILFSEQTDIRHLTLEKGILYPSDEELVMMILGTGTKGSPVEKLAQDVIRCLRTSSSENRIKNLCKIKGMGTGKALSIVSALELGRRQNNHKGIKIKTPSDVIPFVRNYSVEKKEHFISITVNGGHEIIQIRVISVGTVNQTLVHPREIFSDALKENAAAIVICHNHPSGDCTPSDADIGTTHRLMQAAEIMGISLLDHIIFSGTSYFSFLENNLLYTD